MLQWKSTLKYQQSIAHILGLKWEEFRGRIETELVDKLAEDQQAVLQGRKQLVDATKEFKRAEDDKKISELPSLLKGNPDK